VAHCHQRRGGISKEVKEREGLTVDADIDISKKDKYIDTLVTTNMRRDGRDYPAGFWPGGISVH